MSARYWKIGLSLLFATTAALILSSTTAKGAVEPAAAYFRGMEEGLRAGREAFECGLADREVLDEALSAARPFLLPSGRLLEVEDLEGAASVTRDLLVRSARAYGQAIVATGEPYTGTVAESLSLEELLAILSTRPGADTAVVTIFAEAATLLSKGGADGSRASKEALAHFEPARIAEALRAALGVGSDANPENERIRYRLKKVSDVILGSRSLAIPILLSICGECPDAPCDQGLLEGLHEAMGTMEPAESFAALKASSSAGAWISFSKKYFSLSDGARRVIARGLGADPLSLGAIAWAVLVGAGRETAQTRADAYKKAFSFEAAWFRAAEGVSREALLIELGGDPVLMALLEGEEAFGDLWASLAAYYAGARLDLERGLVGRSARYEGIGRCLARFGLRSHSTGLYIMEGEGSAPSGPAVALRGPEGAIGNYRLPGFQDPAMTLYRHFCEFPARSEDEDLGSGGTE